MPTKLRKLKITRVAVCEQGANYDPVTDEGAHILLFKSAVLPTVEKHDACPDPTPVTPSSMPPIGSTRLRRRTRVVGKQDHGEPDGDEAPPMDYATRSRQRDLWGSLWDKWMQFCDTYSACVGDGDEDNVAHLPILVTSIGQFQADVVSLLSDLDLVAKTAPAMATLTDLATEMAKVGAPMAGHRLGRLQEAIRVLQEIFDECVPETIERLGVAAAEVVGYSDPLPGGIPSVRKEGETPMAVRKNTESDKEHCAQCDDEDCDHPAHDRLKKEELVEGNAAQAQIDALTKRAETAEARVQELEAQVAKRTQDLATLQDEIAISKMSPEDQREQLLKSMPELVRKSYLDQEARLEMIEKSNRELHDKNQRLDYIQKTAAFRHIGFVPDDHWEILKSIDGMPEAPRTDLLRLLTAAAEQLRTSDLFKAHGSAAYQPGSEHGSAEAQILALAQARAEEKGEPLGKAIEAIAKQHPDLWERDQQEKRRTNRVQLGSR